MDRHELNIKVEQLKKLVREGDYKTAAEIADAIDWRKVQSSNLLSIVSDVYENIGEYAEAKTILLMAYEKSSMGKRMLYRLTELAIKEGSIDEAYKYYEEFERVAMDDSRVYLLRYKMLSAKHADINQRIHALETYNSRELDEKYQYKLAELYYEAGRTDDSVRMCDNIMLMFGLGHYVEKAIELKTTKLGMELTEYQNSLIVNREHYAEKLREVELEYSGEYDTIYAENYEKVEDPTQELEEIDAEIAAHMKALESDISEEASIVAVDEIQEAVSYEAGANAIYWQDTAFEEESVHTKLQEEHPYTEAVEKEPVKEESLQAEHAEKSVTQATSAQSSVEEKIHPTTDAEDIFEEVAESTHNLYLMVASKDMSKALQESTSKIRAWNDGREEKKAATKTSAEKLNARGLRVVKDKIQGKVVVVENAGDLHEENVNILLDWILSGKEDISFVLLDTPLQISNLIRNNKELEEHFAVDFIDKVQPKQAAEEDLSKAVQKEAQKEIKVEVKSEVEEKTSDRIPVIVEEAPPVIQTEIPISVSRKKEEKRAVSEKKEEAIYSQDFLTERIDVETFVEYASEYAQKIDCSISGRSLLALYERTEIMEADGEILSRERAKELIEEVADIAENPPLTSKVKALLTFDKKYDKNDRLILKEEYFIS